MLVQCLSGGFGSTLDDTAGVMELHHVVVVGRHPDKDVGFEAFDVVAGNLLHHQARRFGQEFVRVHAAAFAVVDGSIDIDGHKQIA